MSDDQGVRGRKELVGACLTAPGSRPSDQANLRCPDAPRVDPSRGKAPIWGYARALGKALIQIAPEDFRLEWQGGGGDQALAVSCTITTQQEAEAVCEIIMTLARGSLSSRREAVRGDIYPPEPKPSFQEELEAALGRSDTAGSPKPKDPGSERYPGPDPAQPLDPQGQPS